MDINQKPRIRFYAGGMCNVTNFNSESVPAHRRFDAIMWCSMHNEQVALKRKPPLGLNMEWPRLPRGCTAGHYHD
jgi:hypothetical protein